MDRLTELQGYVDQMGTLLYESIGRIQNTAPPSKLNIEGFSREYEYMKDPNAPILTDEQISELSSAIINTSKTIEMYIKSLPGIEETEEEQLKKIAELEKENNELGNMIIEKVKDAEAKLSIIDEALLLIAKNKIYSQKQM